MPAPCSRPNTEPNARTSSGLVAAPTAFFVQSMIGPGPATQALHQVNAAYQSAASGTANRTSGPPPARTTESRKTTSHGPPFSRKPSAKRAANQASLESNVSRAATRPSRSVTIVNGVPAV